MDCQLYPHSWHWNISSGCLLKYDLISPQNRERQVSWRPDRPIQHEGLGSVHLLESINREPSFNPYTCQENPRV